MADENEERIEVTEENFGDLLIRGLKEAGAVVRREREPARQVRRPMTARSAEVAPPRRYSGDGVQRIREKMGLSQSVFAEVLNASPETVKGWEQGKRQPEGMALALLEVAEHHPEALMHRVKKKGPGGRAQR